MPYRHFQIQTRLTQSQAVETLAFCSPKARLPESVEAMAFDFKADQTIFGRNHFRPMVHVKYRLAPQGILIEVTMKLPLFTSILSRVWLGGMLLILLLIGLDRSQGNNLFDALPLMLLICFYLLITVGFVPEAMKEERYIRKLFRNYEI